MGESSNPLSKTAARSPSTRHPHGIGGSSVYLHFILLVKKYYLNLNLFLPFL